MSVSIAVRSGAEHRAQGQDLGLHSKVKQWNTALRTSSEYKLAFERWKTGLTQYNADLSWFEARCTTRFYTGGGELHPWQTNVTTHRTHGAPYFPGSGLKGAAKACCSRLTWPNDQLAEVLAAVFGEEKTESTEGKGGAVIFHDAWCLPPTSDDTPFVAEVVTPHHQAYYSGKHSNQALSESVPRDTEDPIPAPQLAVTGQFLFAVEGDADLRNVAVQLLHGALTHEGVGARTSLGYGRFEVINPHLGWSEKELIDNLSASPQQVRNTYGPALASIRAFYVNQHGKSKLYAWFKTTGTPRSRAATILLEN